jgi:DUF438 domain-containing protein
MSTRLSRWQADLEKVETQLTNANTALEEILESQMNDYEFENSDSRQRVKLQNIETLKKVISYLETKREKLYSKIEGRGHTQALRLRR